MIELTLTYEAEQYGRRRKKNLDRRGITDDFKTRGADKRWTGHAVEYLLHQWLSEQGLQHKWNGGLDNRPDFEIGATDGQGIRVASKSNSGDAPRDDFLFVVPEHHVKKLGDGALFSIIQIRERRVWIAGYIDARKFRQAAEKHKKGDPGFVPGRSIEHDCRSIRADQLRPAELFFGLLAVAA